MKDDMQEMRKKLQDMMHKAEQEMTEVRDFIHKNMEKEENKDDLRNIGILCFIAGFITGSFLTWLV